MDAVDAVEKSSDKSNINAQGSTTNVPKVSTSADRSRISHEHIVYIMYQLLRGTRYMHSANMIHRDLKPSNLLVNRNVSLKITDFDFVRDGRKTPDKKPTEPFTNYVVTRWYRGPEVMLCQGQYDVAIDMWSIGCIFGELLAGGYPLFPGNDSIDQLKRIFTFLGMPDQQTLRRISSDQAFRYYSDNRHKFESKKVHQEKVGNLSDVWTKWYNGHLDDRNLISIEAVDLLSKMLVIDPAQRISADDALKHPFFKGMYVDSKLSQKLDTCTKQFDLKYEVDLKDQFSAQTMYWHELLHYRPHAHIKFTAWLDRRDLVLKAARKEKALKDAEKALKDAEKALVEAQRKAAQKIEEAAQKKVVEQRTLVRVAPVTIPCPYTSTIASTIAMPPPPAQQLYDHFTNDETLLRNNFVTRTSTPIPISRPSANFIPKSNDLIWFFLNNDHLCDILCL